MSITPYNVECELGDVVEERSGVDIVIPRSAPDAVRYYSENDFDVVCARSKKTGPVIIGNAQSLLPRNFSKLQKTFGVRAVVSLCNKIIHVPDGVSIYSIQNLFDRPSENIYVHFDKCIEFITQHETTGVLVHCMQGVSRSATILAAYFMVSRGMTLRDSLLYLRNARGQSNPNSGFMRQLMAYEKHLVDSGVLPVDTTLTTLDQINVFKVQTYLMDPISVAAWSKYSTDFPSDTLIRKALQETGNKCFVAYRKVLSAVRKNCK